MISRVSLGALLAIIALTINATVALKQVPALQQTAPSPSLDPDAVVRIQVEALRTNGPLNEGIELTYRFASPGNKQVTGPLDRFVRMVRSPPYDRLLNHLNASYGPVSISGDEAFQTVTVTDRQGKDAAYLWVLSRQSEGQFKGCWMTDAVISAERPTRNGFAIRAITFIEKAPIASVFCGFRRHHLSKRSMT